MSDTRLVVMAVGKEEVIFRKGLSEEYILTDACICGISSWGNMEQTPERIPARSIRNEWVHKQRKSLFTVEALSSSVPKFVS